MFIIISLDEDDADIFLSLDNDDDDILSLDDDDDGIFSSDVDDNFPKKLSIFLLFILIWSIDSVCFLLLACESKAVVTIVADNVIGFLIRQTLQIAVFEAVPRVTQSLYLGSFNHQL